MDQQAMVGSDLNGRQLTESEQSMQDALINELCTPQRQIAGVVSPTSGSMTISPSFPGNADHRGPAPLQDLPQDAHRGRVGG